MTIITSIWFTPPYPATNGSMANIGVVVIETAQGRHKAYIGYGEGHDQEYDEELIAKHGAKFPLVMAKAFWPQYDFIN